MSRRNTPEQLALVRELYPTHTAAEIARRLFGSPRAAKAVYWIALSLGLRKHPHHAPELLDQVRGLVREGLTDAAIGRQLGLPRETISHIRSSRLKLPRNEAAIKEAGRRAVKKQQATLGIRSGGELRQWAYRRYAAENGWPQDLRPREVQILNVLAAAGVPLTRLALAEAIGANTSPTHKTGKRRIPLSNNSHGARGGTYTASLAQKGFLVRLPRASQDLGGGKGKSVDLYTLSSLALAILQERAEKEIQCLNPATAEATS